MAGGGPQKARILESDGFGVEIERRRSLNVSRRRFRDASSTVSLPLDHHLDRRNRRHGLRAQLREAWFPFLTTPEPTDDPQPRKRTPPTAEAQPSQATIATTTPTASHPTATTTRRSPTVAKGARPMATAEPPWTRTRPRLLSFWGQRPLWPPDRRPAFFAAWRSRSHTHCEREWAGPIRTLPISFFGFFWPFLRPSHAPPRSQQRLPPPPPQIRRRRPQNHRRRQRGSRRRRQ